MGLPIVNDGMLRDSVPGTAPHEEEREIIKSNLALVRRKVGIISGKGGVGKTFVAVNLSLAIAAAGKRVGLLDADIDCPNVARFLNLRDQPLSGSREGRIQPLDHRGLRIVSTHFLTDDSKAPMIVRGPIKHKILAELLSNVDWGELDALIIDLPPGTADVPMSTMLLTGLDGVVVVTTPSKESLLDARKSALMARDLKVPVLGVVENMAGDAFGSGAGKQLADELGVPFLGTIPLSREIRELSENGRAALVEIDALVPAAQALVGVALGEAYRIFKKRSFWSRMLDR